MASNINFNSSPYFDDYNEDDKFHKILYRPGYAVQARELNQTQSILQNQVERFGNHVFDNGAMVSPGNIKLDLNYRYIQIATNYQDGSQEAIGNELSSFIGYTLRNSSNTLRAKVINYIETTSAPIPYITLYLAYEGNDSSDGVTEEFSSNETIVFSESLRELLVLSSGIGSAAHVAEGIYYVNGFFVKNSAQTVILDPYGQFPTYSVGFLVQESVITPEENIELLDNAFGTTNYSAPGAYRYKIDLLLTKLQLNSEGTSISSSVDPKSYIQLLKVISGEIYSIVDRTSYSVLEETLARRTYDESGDYVIDSFSPSFHEHFNDGSNGGFYLDGDETKFVVSLDGGKAYVRGYEISTYNQTLLESRKARGSDHIKYANNSAVPTSLGAYILIDFDDVNSIFPQMSNYPLINVIDGSSNVIGTLRIRAIIPHGSTSYFRAYIFDVTMNSGKNFSTDAKRLFLSQMTNNFDVDIVNDDPGDEATSVSIYNVNNNIAVFPIERSPVFSVLDTNYITIESFDAGASAGSLSITTGQSNRTFDLSSLSVSNVTDGGIVSTTNYTYSLGSGGTQLTLSGIGIVNGKNYRIITTVNNVSINNSSAFRLRTKALQQTSIILSSPTSTISLGKADILSVDVEDDNGNDITYKYTIDNGQRDNFYDIGKIILNPGESVTAPITVHFEYFSHGNGDYFAANSYPEELYDVIPVYTSSGTSIDLTNALDFRPVKSASNDFTGIGSLTGSYVYPNGTFFSDIYYYVGRIDKVVLSSSGEFSIVEGIPSIDPIPPKDIPDAITLHNVIVPAYTYTIGDVRVKSNSFKRYKMSDISSLETRIGNLEYYTSLSLLEKETQNLTILDSNGNDKFKNGFFVDSFISQDSAGIDDQDFKIAIDLETAECRPISSTKSVKFDAKIDSMSNTVKTGDLVTLAYQEKAEISQTLYSSTINVNPFSVFSWLGTIVLDPSVDTWYSTERAPDIIVEGGVVDSIAYQTQQDSIGTIWNNWQTIWSGSTSTRSDTWKSGRNYYQTETTTTNSVQSRTGLQTSAISRVETKVIDNRVIAQVVVPWIRERLVSFEASLLKPNTLHYCFFGERNVTSYVTQTGPVARSIGTGVMTDASGKASGTFLIPNNDSLRFSTGTQVLKLYNKSTLSDTTGDSSGKATYTATGILSTEQSTVISTRVNDIQTVPVSDSRTVTSVSTKDVYIGDPVAQSFFVTLDGGMFITSIEIPFATKDSNIPITIQIREMNNGVPTMNILPFGSKTLYPSNILSNSGTPTFTKFVFDSPVYVQNGFEYCFVLMSNSDQYNVFKATLGENDLTTGQPIVKQPYIGVMFKSQNNSTWTEDQLSDLTFKINRAKFISNSGSVVFVESTPTSDIGYEADPFTSYLETNPYITLSGSNLIKVMHRNHGFVANDIVTLYTPIPSPAPTSGSASNNINLSNLNGNFFVLNPQVDYYFILLTGNIANASGRIGGVGCKATNIVAYDVVQFSSNTIQPSGTGINWNCSLTSKNSTGSRVGSSIIPITINENIFMSYAHSVVKGSNDTNVIATLSTSSDNISPVIDTQFQSGYFTQNKVNNILPTTPSYGGYDIYVSEEENISSSAAKYISKNISLLNPSTSLRVYVDAVRQSEANIEVWFKSISINNSGSSIKDVPYTRMTEISYPGISQTDTDYREYVFGDDNLDPFQSYVIKIVFKSSNTSVPPKIMNLRSIALA